MIVYPMTSLLSSALMTFYILQLLCFEGIASKRTDTDIILEAYKEKLAKLVAKADGMKTESYGTDHDSSMSTKKKKDNDYQESDLRIVGIIMPESVENLVRQEKLSFNTEEPLYSTSRRKLSTQSKTKSETIELPNDKIDSDGLVGTPIILKQTPEQHYQAQSLLVSNRNPEFDTEKSNKGASEDELFDPVVVLTAKSRNNVEEEPRLNEDVELLDNPIENPGNVLDSKTSNGATESEAFVDDNTDVILSREDSRGTINYGRPGLNLLVSNEDLIDNQAPKLDQDGAFDQDDWGDETIDKMTKIGTTSIEFENEEEIADDDLDYPVLPDPPQREAAEIQEGPIESYTAGVDLPKVVDSVNGKLQSSDAHQYGYHNLDPAKIENLEAKAESESESLGEKKYALIRDIVALTIATVAMTSAIFFIGFTAMHWRKTMKSMKREHSKNREQINNLKKDVKRMAATARRSPDCDSLSMDEIDIDSSDDDEIPHKPSWLERIRSSDAVETLSLMKTMNPFAKWGELKRRSREMLKNQGYNGKDSYVVETGGEKKSKQSTDIPVLMVEQSESDLQFSDKEDDSHTKRKRNIIQRLSQHKIDSGYSTGGYIARIVAVVVAVVLVLAFVITPIYLYSLEKGIESEEEKDTMALEDISKELSNIEKDTGTDGKRKLKLLGIISKQLSQMHRDMDTEESSP